MADLDKAKEELNKLIDRYNKHKEDKSFIGNEDQAGQSLIRPLIRDILHYDVEDPSEFKMEESQRGKRIDYVIYDKGISQFIVEAKAPSRDIFDVDDFYKQAVTYGYNKGHDFAILTNFKQIVVLACKIAFRTIKEAEIGRIDILNAADEDLTFLLNFEKNNWLSGKKEALFARLSKHKRSSAVDERLLEDLTHWRELLLTNIQKNKNKFDFEDEKEFMHIEEEIQRLIDRLVFICFCEDKELHEPHLKGLLYDKKDRFTLKPGYLLSKIQELFSDYRRVYDSDLFDKGTCDLFLIDDDVLIKILEGLREPKERLPYDFKSIEADILGKTYENFIGHLTTGKKRFKEKEDIGKRKKEGIYYTPKYIVDYIVNNTVREYIKGKLFNDIKKVKILDPACGSGSFLLRAFDVLVEECEKKNGKLTYEEKKELMLNCIFGVDLDERAVEIAKLSLSLKLAERDKNLPMLRENIRIGNSLIDDKSIAGFKAFAWEDEFKDVFKQGGFDVIIGNPPYIKEYTNKSAFDGLHNSPYYQGKMDIWTLFACRAIDFLKSSGILSFIAPNNWLTNAGASIFRNKILIDGEISNFVDFGDFKVFEEAGIQTMIFIFKKNKQKTTYQTDYIKITNKNLDEDVISSLLSNQKIINDSIIKFKATISPKQLIGKNIVFSNIIDDKILTKIESRKNFELADNEVAQGIVAAPDKYFVIKNLSKFNKMECEFIKPFYTSTNKYSFSKTDSYIFYICDKNFNGKCLDDYPNIRNHFEPFKKILKEAKIKYGTPDKSFFYLHREREEKFFQKGPKIIGQTRTTSPSFLYTEEEYYGSRAMNFIKTNRINLKFLTGLLNSKLSYFWLKNKGKQLGDLLQIDKGPLLNIPLINPEERFQKEIASLVDKEIYLHKQFNETTTIHIQEKEKIQKEIEKTDKEIDELVYKLYGITEEEKKIIEESLK